MARSGINMVTKKLKGGRKCAVRIDWRKERNWNKAHFGWENVKRASADMQEALDLAADADAVIVCSGFTSDTESEAVDRSFGLPGLQESFICQVADVNPNVAVLLHAGGGVGPGTWLERTKALLHVWYPGQNGGIAAGEILAGKVNPSGKLPATFERGLEDRGSTSCYHDTDEDKRVQLDDGVFTGYRHFDREDIEPLFPFGFGLSYTSFAYENLSLSAEKLDVGQALTVSFDVTNTGDCAGAEVAQLYLSDVEATLPRPAKELKGFEKVHLEPGERKTVEIKLCAEAFEFFDMDIREWASEPGEFRVLVGASATDIRLEGSFTLLG
jgi:beta-glucosidase